MEKITWLNGSTPGLYKIGRTSRAHEHLDLGAFHFESRGFFARRCCLCRLCEDGCYARSWSLVDKVDMVVTAAPMANEAWPPHVHSSAVHCFTIISRYAALRPRGRRHVFLVAQLLSHEHVVDMIVTAVPTQSFSWTDVESVLLSWYKDSGVFC